MNCSAIVRGLARVSLALALPIWLGVAAVGLAQPAHAAATITVSSCDESDLDAAIAQANSDNAGDTITFSCSGTIDLTSTLDITGSMTLDGTGQQVALDGQNQVRVLSVSSGVTFAINRLTVQDGSVTGDGAGLFNDGGTVNIDDSTFSGNVAGDSGGAVQNSVGGTLTITNSTFSTNRVDQDYGGAVNNGQGSTATITSSSFQNNDAQTQDGGGALANGGTMTIARSSFGLNQGEDGGALYNTGAGTTMSVVNSSFSFNDSVGSGGALYAHGGAVNIAFSTFWGDNAGSGANLYIDIGKVTVEGSVLADGPDNCGGGPPTDDGYNMETGTDCGFTGTGDLQNASPGFGQESNGSLYLMQGSPGIDAVPLSRCPATDQNGNPRPDDPSETACDMGAAESDYEPALVLSSSADPSTFGQPVTITAVVPATDGGGTVAFTAHGSPTPISGCAAQPLTQGSGGTYSATCTFTPDWAGTQPVTATYSGDASYQASTGTLPGGQTVNPATTLLSSPDPSVSGQPVTFTATVTPTDGGGTVAFYADGSATPISGCGTQPLTQASGFTYTATCTTSSLAAGSHAIAASYSGDSLYAASSGSLPGGQTVNPAATATSLSSSPDPSASGQPVTFTATVTPTDGGGTVAFYADGSATPISGCGTQLLTQASGSTYTATCTTSSLAAGSHAIAASYSGDSNYAGSTGSLAGGQTVNPAAQSISFTAPATGTVGGSATLTATGGASGNPVIFSVDPSSGVGVCTVSGTNGSTVTYTAAGSCVIDANQAGNAGYAAAPQVTQTITVNQAPAFVLDSPPTAATTGQPYDYTFQASGTPAPTYALASGAPSWLSVNASTGEVTGTPPSGTTSFSYAVTAANVAGTATAGPFTVTVTKPSPNADISATLTCPASLTVGGTGTCTLTVANAGPATASKVIAAIALPAALSETSCSPGCARHANIYTWTLASLASGTSAKFTITVKASRTGTATVLAAAASQSPDPHPLNNISIQQISIKH